MTRRPSTLILAGALAAACSKPNPLFLDTLGPTSDTDGPSTTGTNTVTGMPGTTTEPTSAGTTAALTTTDPGSTGTTGTTTSTSTSSSSTSGGPTSDATTDAPFFCVPNLEGCCEVRIDAIADSFFTDATDIAMQQECPVVGMKVPKCARWSFGRAKELTLFNDGDGFMGLQGVSVMALQFPMEAGQLVVGGDVIPWSVVNKAVLELSVTTNWQIYNEFEFRLYWMPESDAWFEGDDGMGPVECFGDDSSYACRKCGPDPVTCEGWSAVKPIVVANKLDELVAEQGAEPTLLDLPITTPSSLADAHTGLVVMPFAVKYMGEVQDVVPGHALTVKARESETPPALRLWVCMN